MHFMTRNMYTRFSRKSPTCERFIFLWSMRGKRKRISVNASEKPEIYRDSIEKRAKHPNENRPNNDIGYFPNGKNSISNVYKVCCYYYYCAFMLFLSGFCLEIK